MKRLDTHSFGFTTIELIVTLLVTSIFVISLYQLFGSINASMSLTRQRAAASELAYSYLRRYAGNGQDTQPATWFTCSTAGGVNNTNDYTVNTNAPGQTLASGAPTDIQGLARPVTYTVKALAIYGCSGSNTGSPLRVTVTVTYGPQNKSVTHSTLVGY